jgi:hypothetical protein
MNAVTNHPPRSSGQSECRPWSILVPVPALVVMLAGLATAGAAVAAGDDPAQRLFSAGVEAARENRWADAREAFERAYGLSQRPVVLINLAGAEVRTGRLTEAANDYRRIVEGDPSPETSAFRKAAADMLPSLEARIPRIQLHTSGLGAADVVEIDGEEIPSGRLEQPHLIDPGSHVVVVKRSGVERARVSFSVAEGESHDISVPVPLDSLTLSPLTPSAPEAPPTSAAGVDLELGPDRTSPPPARRSVWRSPWLWTAIAAVAVGTTVATLVAVRSHDQAFSGNLSPGTITVP